MCTCPECGGTSVERVQELCICKYPGCGHVWECWDEIDRDLAGLSEETLSGLSPFSDEDGV